MKIDREFLQDFLKKKQNRLGLLVVCGILFLLLSWPQDKTSGTPAPTTSGTQERASDDTSAYVADLETRLAGILSRIDGAGEVEVMITLQTSSERILQEDANISENLIQDSGENSSRSESSSSRSTSTFTGEDSSPYVVKELMPVVEGVVVAADGAGSASICQEIKDAVQALFPVEAHKIKVLKRES